MNIIKVDPFDVENKHIVSGIVQVYINAFSGSPWFEVWEYARVQGDLNSEMRKDGAMCIAALHSEEVAGFAWGYTMQTSEKSLLDLCVPALRLPKNTTLFYLDEIAVKQEEQAKGIGKALFAYIREKNPGGILLRTKKGSAMQSLVLSSGGRTLTEISKGRVMMVVDI